MVFDHIWPRPEHRALDSRQQFTDCEPSVAAGSGSASEHMDGAEWGLFGPIKNSCSGVEDESIKAGVCGPVCV